MAAEARAYEGEFHGEAAVWLLAGDFEAAVLPRVGANLIALRHKSRGYRILREPEPGEMEAFKANPGVHGIPVLFPPNRYEDGRFPWKGKEYRFPINEPARNNRLHGFVHTLPWEVERYGADGGEARVVLSLRVDESHPIYAYLPHRFTLTLVYTLSEEGLHQQIRVRNDGEDEMPCLLAFHTAINAPFAPGSKAGDCRVKITVGKRWEMNERMLPTGRFQPLGPVEAELPASGISPYFEEMDNHYTAAPQDGRNRMELTDSRERVKLVYDVGTGFKHWMVWNGYNSGSFFCPEPQVNLVNAPNVSGLPPEEIGLIGLEPGAIWEETSRLYLIDLK